MADQLCVDLDALLAFADQLDSIRQRMDATRDLFDSYDDAVGSPDLSHELAHFDSNWKDGRKKIDGNATKLVDAARDIAHGLADTDAQLAQQLARNTPKAPDVGAAQVNRRG